MKKTNAVWIVLAVAFSLVALGQTQTTFGSITGTVRDSSGSFIPGVTVNARGPGGISTVVSNERGAYVLSNIQPGIYTVSASLPGFATATISGVQVSGGSATEREFTLQVSQRESTVQVPRPFPGSPNPDIRADRQTRQGTVLQYRGNVRMTTNGLEVRADELDFDETAGTGDVRGNVTFRVLPRGAQGGARVIPLGQ
jgi:hypothetical protein